MSTEVIEVIYQHWNNHSVLPVGFRKKKSLFVTEMCRDAACMIAAPDLNRKLFPFPKQVTILWSF